MDNKEIATLSTKNGNATVVMNTGKYRKQTKTILKDVIHKPVTRDLTTNLEKTSK